VARTLYRWIEPHATRWKIALCGVLWVTSALVIITLQHRVASVAGGLTVPDMLPLYTPADLYTLLEQYGEAGRTAYLFFALFDIFYPFAAYAFVALVLAALVRSGFEGRPPWVSVLLLPAAGLFVELLEQAGFLLILFLFPSPVAYVAGATSVLSLLKLAILLALALTALGLLPRVAWRRIRRPTKR
jgi:hypothetical protein